jgi:hypothetical protein
MSCILVIFWQRGCFPNRANIEVSSRLPQYVTYLVRGETWPPVPSTVQRRGEERQICRLIQYNGWIYEEIWSRRHWHLPVDCAGLRWIKWRHTTSLGIVTIVYEMAPSGDREGDDPANKLKDHLNNATDTIRYIRASDRGRICVFYTYKIQTRIKEGVGDVRYVLNVSYYPKSIYNLLKISCTNHQSQWRGVKYTLP